MFNAYVWFYIYRMNRIPSGRLTPSQQLVIIDKIEREKNSKHPEPSQQDIEVTSV